MWTGLHHSGTAAVPAPSTTRAYERILCGCALLGTFMAGCSGLEYSRVSGETYYSWLVSSYSPVVQFGEKRLEGEGVCFHLNAGKSQIQGFVTIQDLSAAAIANPDLVARARLYQQAFSEGMLKGMTDSVNESAGLADGSSILAKELDTPAHLKRY